MKKYNFINNALGWLCFVIAAITYLLTIEPTASFWDCPEFIAQGAKLEVGHPPGNPIFMLTARFFVTIFGNNIQNAALAVNTMSALLSAATILLLFWTITALVKRIMLPDTDEQQVPLAKMLVIMGSGLCGALAFTWSDTFWFSAVEGEVYAFSSFCTALVFWLILKWENRADKPHSDRYIVLIAYVIGVSIAVHLLNLLCIPAIVLVFYYRKWKNVNAVGSLIALAISFVIVAAILYGLVPGFIKVAQWFELLCVNTFGMSYNMGVLLYAILLVALFVWTIATLQQGENPGLIKVQMLLVAMASGLTFATNSGWVWCLLVAAAAIYLFAFCPKVPQRIFNLIAISIFVIFVGYSSYALLLIRASANTPMNQNAPDNVFALSSYLNREQYGQRPLLKGPVFADSYSIVQLEDGAYYVPVTKQGLPQTTALSMGDALLYKPQGDSYVPWIDREYGYAKVAKADPSQPDEYVREVESPTYHTSPDLDMLFPRMYSFDPSHVRGYKSWSAYENPDLYNILRNVPAERRQQWAKDGYAPLYQIAPYMQHASTAYITTDKDDRMSIPVWKGSWLDNLRYFVNYQLNHMYWRYFMWNFAGRQNDMQGNGERNLGNWISGIPFIDNMRLGDQSLVPTRYTTENKGHNVFYMLPLLMGLIGIFWQALGYHRLHPRRGIEQFWVIFFLFFMTGIAIVLYLNQTPGQPRERDYAFAGSFYAYAIWIGLGVAGIYSVIAYFCELMAKKPKDTKAAQAQEELPKGAALTAAAWAVAIGIAVPVQMVSQTWDDHDRSNRYTTRDFGANYLNSLAPNAIIFTNGDNDTFPLWYQQEVEGLRTDVRVVNLSYLSTDWYANQMQHPYYDAAAVEMLAKPTDYAYDRLGANRVSRYPLLSNSDSVLNPITGAFDSLRYNGRFEALEALSEYYANPGAGIQKPHMVSVVDPMAAIKAFNLDLNGPDAQEAMPYMTDIAMDGLANGGSLSTLLSFDIIANSVADGFERPVYFASTVPSDYYLGLDPYLYSTGMALQVTPFQSAASSPVATTAYENILSKFRWGGLDDPNTAKKLYLDETVRRMVSTTRSNIIDVAENLILRGDEPATEFAIEYAKANGTPVPATKYDMARILLNLVEEKLPIEAVPYENLTDMQLIAPYLKLHNHTGNPEDLARATALYYSIMPFYGQLVNYASTFANPARDLSRSDRALLLYMPGLLAAKAYIDMAQTPEFANLEPEVKQLLDEAVSYEMGAYVADYALTNYSVADLMTFANSPNAGDLRTVLYPSIAMAQALDQTGIDRANLPFDEMERFGSDYDALRNLQLQ